MNIKRTLLGLALVLLGGAASVLVFVTVQNVLIAWTWSSGDIQHKSDEELIANFKTHEAQFNQLLDMVMADKGLRRVDNDWTDPSDPKAIGVSDERVATYRKMFRDLQIPRGFYAYHDEGIVRFISSSQGLAVSGSSKSYVWFKEPPSWLKEQRSRLVENIDEYRSRPGGSYPVYRPIQGSWYLTFDAD